MEVIKQSVTLDSVSNLTEEQALLILAKALSIPYDKACPTEAIKKRLITVVKKGHLSLLEHVNLVLDCITNIGTYKDFTRHRHCAFTIESTSFVKYGEFRIILTDEELLTPLWKDIEVEYIRFVKDHGVKKARDILPQAQAARMLMTTNLRQWRYILGLRSDPNDNPLTNQLRDLMFKAFNGWSSFFFPSSDQEGLQLEQYWK